MVWRLTSARCAGLRGGRDLHQERVAIDRVVTPQLTHSDGHMRPTGEVMVAKLHEWDAHDHAHIGNAAIESRGGVLLWFLSDDSDDFDALMQRVSGNDIVVLDGLMLHPNSGQREAWMRGPEGYVMVVAGPADRYNMRA